MKRMNLKEALRAALDKTLSGGWLYLPRDREPSPELECVLVGDEESELDDKGVAIVADEAGFGREGLDLARRGPELQRAPPRQPAS